MTRVMRCRVGLEPEEPAAPVREELVPDPSAEADEDGESRFFLFFLGPIAAKAVRLASLCLI